MTESRPVVQDRRDSHGRDSANTITVVMGAPGTGKTILAEEIAFFNATEERPGALPDNALRTAREVYLSRTEYSFSIWQVGKSVIYEDLGMMVRERD